MEIPASQDCTSTARDALHIPMRISERRLLLLTLDFLAVNGALLAALALRPAYVFDLALVIRRPLWFFVITAIWFPVARALDAYELHIAGELPLAALAVAKAGLLTTVIYLLIPFLTPPLPTARWQLFALPLLTMAFASAGRALYVLAWGQPAFRRRLLIVGAGWAGRTIAHALTANGNNAYHVVGFVDDDPAKQGTVVSWGAHETTGSLNRAQDSQGDKARGTGGESRTEEGQGRPEEALAEQDQSSAVLGDRHALPDLIDTHAVNTLILAITEGVDGKLLGIVTDCLAHGVEVIPMPVLYEQLTGRVPIEHVGGQWYAAMPVQPRTSAALWPMTKRVFDLVSAGVGAFLLVLAFPFIALAIYADSPGGPIFYTQERVGKGGRTFRLYKFRSMVPDAEKFGEAVWAEDDDPRVTRVGRLLRKTHVDEFPQFFNILKGDMSAVGPRPERPEFVDELAEEIAFYRVRHTVKPGMAGWGLVNQGYGSSKEDAKLKLQYDLYYIKHQTLWLDIVILLKTIIDTVTFGGR